MLRRKIGLEGGVEGSWRARECECVSLYGVNFRDFRSGISQLASIILLCLRRRVRK